MASAPGSKKNAVAAWIYAGGAHHTGFSFAVASGHLRDFAEIAGLEFLLIDENTRMEDSKHQLCWNEAVYHKGFELSWLDMADTFRSIRVFGNFGVILRFYVL